MANLQEELIIRIRADTAQLQREMQKANNIVQTSAKGMSSGLAGVASQARALLPVLSAAAFASFIKGAINAGDELDEMATKTGVSIKALSSLQLYAKQNGVSIEQLAQSFRFMNNNMLEAPKAFTQLGISLGEFKKLSTEQQFIAIADKVNQLGTTAEKTKALIDIFGRAGNELAPMFANGAEGIKKAVEQAEKLGLVLSPEEAAKMAQFNDAWDTMTSKLQRLGQEGFLSVYTTVVALRDEIKLLNRDMSGLTQDKVYYESATNKAEIRKGTEKINKLKSGTSPLVLDDLGLGYETRGAAIESERAVQANRLKKQAALDEQIKIFQAEDVRKAEAVKTDSNKPKIKLPPTAGEGAKDIDSAKKSLAEYNQELQRKANLDALSPQQQAGMEAYYKTLDLAQKAGIKNAQELAKQNQGIAESIYTQKKAQEEAIRINDQWHESLSSALTDAIMNFNSASDAAANLAKSIASMIIQRSIAEPLTNALLGEKGTSGGGILGSLMSHLPSFAVGADNIPNDMVANIHKGEMIIPAVQAQSIRSGNTGSTLTLVQNNNFSSGVTRAEVASMLPSVAKAAHDAVFTSIQRGGSAAKIVGVR